MIKALGLVELLKMLLTHKQEFTMSKEQIISDAKAAFVAGQDQALSDVLGSVYDQAVASVPPADADEQAKIDAAVAAAVEPLNSKIAQDAADLSKAVSDGQAAVAVVQASLDSMTAKELGEEQVVQGLKDAVAAFQAVLSGLPVA